jgi:hypothetical protein
MFDVGYNDTNVPHNLQKVTGLALNTKRYAEKRLTIWIYDFRLTIRIP